MPALCRVNYEGQCRNPPTFCCIWMRSDEVKSGLLLYCEEHMKYFKQLGSIKVLEARR